MTGHSIGDAAHHPMSLKRAGEDSHGRHASVAALTVAAVGIVYGGIATSPLYALDQLFLRHGGVPLTPQNVLGGISLVILTITVIVAIKYACFVLRAQNDGEGGVFALYGLLHDYKHRGIMIFLWSLMLGAGLLFGDGIITPAISVLAAVEGLGVATPALGGAVIPVTMLLLTALFAVQVKGTAGIGRSLRSDADRLVHRARNPRCAPNRAARGNTAGIQSGPRPRISRSRRAIPGASRSRVFGIGGDRREAMYADLGHIGVLSDPDQLVHAGVPGAAAQLLWDRAPTFSAARRSSAARSSTVSSPRACFIRRFCWRPQLRSSHRRRSFPAPSRSPRRQPPSGCFRDCACCTRITLTPVRSTFPSSIGRSTPDASFWSSPSAPAPRWVRPMGWRSPA